MDAVALAHKIAFAGDGEPLPAEAAAWLRSGLRRWLLNEADLVIALQLNDAAFLASRNRALLAAALILDDGRGLTAWELSDLLSKAQARFEAGALVQFKRGISTSLSPLNERLLEAWRSGVRPLRSRRRLYDLLSLTNSS
ncbi:MAG: hypothetical protein IPM03_17040 [Sulfuritalea sp.]|nr:hypothetical protein [Sulfuritalea sp.]